VIPVPSIDVNATSCILLVFLEVLMVDIYAKWAKCGYVIEQSLSWKLFSIHKYMDIEVWEESLM
jgi:hypothetical protein